MVKNESVKEKVMSSALQKYISKRYPNARLGQSILLPIDTTISGQVCKLIREKVCK